ncbi:hypothetical protein STRIP9103_01111 [Streptomyces ipomoeae 91-03]|uniref:Uncharacterized protein n=1 Tax=Streptomyces ipomoeae 91-03 TaxID=698759 RepID=L1KYI2_9ACTN|nr:hypothetical protein STRIP9103_01111 [Streptomyces ipomoeae 91-03]
MWAKPIEIHSRARISSGYVLLAGLTIRGRNYSCRHAKRLDSGRPRARSPHDTAGRSRIARPM